MTHEEPAADPATADQPASAEQAVTGSDDTDQHKRKHLPIWQELLLLLGVAVVLAVVVKAFFLQAFYIPSESMEPGLVENDRILVEKVSYWFGDSPERGDVVVFQDPENWLGSTETRPTNPVTKVMAEIGLYPEGGHLVKRVIGVAGDTIVCCDQQGRISVNGEPLDESAYLADEADLTCNGPMTGDCDWRAGPVPDGHIFVMGDNRAHSADSTVHMCVEGETDCTKNPYVDTDLVVGRIFALVWPASRFDFVGRPSSFDDVPDPRTDGE